MKLAIDVYYYDNKAKTVGLIFEQWHSKEPIDIIEYFSQNIHQYEPGNFYKRELPCILGLIDKINLAEIDTIIIDGYVFLDANGRKGLGYYLHKSISNQINIIGVAKKPFINSDALKLYRGKSNNPLYITSIGIDVATAAEHIKSMDGEYRFPNLLKFLDQQTKAPIKKTS